MEIVMKVLIARMTGRLSKACQEACCRRGDAHSSLVQYGAPDIRPRRSAIRGGCGKLRERNSILGREKFDESKRY
jgi:hypothetical protein